MKIAYVMLAIMLVPALMLSGCDGDGTLPYGDPDPDDFMPDDPFPPPAPTPPPPTNGDPGPPPPPPVNDDPGDLMPPAPPII